MRVVDLPQTRLQHVRVYLRRREIGMAEHQLDRAQVGAAIEQMGGKGVPQNVRAHRARQPGAADVLLQDLPEADSTEGPATGVHEQPRRRSSLQQFPAGAGTIALNPVGRLLADGHQALLAPLADACEVLLREVQVDQPDGDQLADAEAGCIQQFDHRAIAEAERRRDVGLRDQPIDFFERKELRQRGPRARRAQVVGWIVFDRAIQGEVAIEAADGGDQARDRTRGEAARALIADERFEIAAVEPVDAALEAGGKRGERGEVASVALQRVLGEPALDAQMIQIAVDAFCVQGFVPSCAPPARRTRSAAV